MAIPFHSARKGARGGCHPAAHASILSAAKLRLHSHHIGVTRGRQLITTIARYLLTTLVWLIIILCLAITIIPRFLDHTYYHGAISNHYDGARFRNIDSGDTQAASPAAASRLGFAWRVLTGGGQRAAWPDSVPVTPGYPDPALTGCPVLTGGARPENWGRCAQQPAADDAMSANWIGHATVLVQTKGFAMLTDPVWSNRAGPFGIGPARVAAPGMRIDDLPKINLIVLSHNHYDHFDLATLKHLWERDHPVIVTALGNDAILKDAGIDAVALDWGGERKLGDVTVRVTRNHHWSSRWGVDRNRALWSSFLIDTPAGRVFFAGDTGFGDGAWAQEAIADGKPVRFAILPIGAFRFQPGQMDVDSHMGPVQSVEIWNRMGRPQTLAVHWGTFRLSNEGYNTPPRMLAEVLRCAGGPADVFTPWKFGEAHRIDPVAAIPALDNARIRACVNDPKVKALP